MAVDPTGTQTFAQMQNANFKPLNGPFNVGYNNKAAFWLRFDVQDPLARTREWWIEIEPPLLDNVDFFEPAQDGQYTRHRTGDRHPFTTRDVPHVGFVFPISPKALPTTYYLRIQSSGALWVKAHMWHSTLISAASVREAHILGIALGILLLLMFTALLQGIVFKDPVYLSYVGYAAATFLLLGSGALALHFPPEGFLIYDAVPPVIACLSVAAYAIFCHYFLYENQESRVFRWLFYFLAAVGLLGAMATIMPALRSFVPLILICKLVGSILPIIVASRRLIHGSGYDRVVWVGIFANVVAQTILFARLSGKVDEQSIWATLHAFNAFIVLHLLLLSFALYERMRRVNKERHQYRSDLATQQLLSAAAHKIAIDQRSFLSMVAHELRGPLAVARSAGYNLRQMLGATPEPNTSKRLDRVDQSLQQMASLIQVCLSHERQGAAQPLSLQESVCIADVNSTALGMMSDAVQARVQWAALGDLALQALPANTALLAIALRNLVENACRYDTSGAPVEVVWQLEETHWRLSVLDRGPGIPTEQIGQLFEPFKRGGQDSAGTEGLGLGLYIVKRIASMLNASVQAQAREDGGSVFYLLLPVAADTKK